jgi:hypothetical protein
MLVSQSLPNNGSTRYNIFHVIVVFELSLPFDNLLGVRQTVHRETLLKSVKPPLSSQNKCIMQDLRFFHGGDYDERRLLGSGAV